MYTKALSWPEIFVISSFAKIDLTGIPVSETDPKINRGFGFGNFRQSVKETNEIIEIFDICQKCRKYTSIFKNSTGSIKNLANSSGFLTDYQNYG